MFEKFDLKNKWKYENGYFLTSDPQRYLKTFFHNELFSLSKNARGDIFEFGVFKGSSLIRFATLSAYFTPKKKIYGFDIFGKFPKQKRLDDNNFIKKFESLSGHGISKKALNNYINLKKLNNVNLIDGDINITLNNFLKKNKPTISLLHIDVDVYQPTKLILENLYDYVSKNGVIIFDDYKVVKGETDAIDEFFKSRKIKKKIRNFKGFISPSYYIKK